MDLTVLQVSAALDRIAERLSDSHRFFAEVDNPWGEASAAWALREAYTHLLTLAESLGLEQLRADIATTFALAQAQGLSQNEPSPDNEPYPKWAAPAHLFTDAMSAVFVTEPAHTVTKSLEEILRAATYAITDSSVFGSPPGDEAVLHHRLEAVLKCLFPDLVHKPRLGKPIKNFEPDTGIPSIQTLIEYKFLASASNVGEIAEQILADTRGYTSREWTSFVYAIYETNRFRSELEWRQLLRASGIGENTTLVVMTGEGAVSQRSRRRPRR